MRILIPKDREEFATLRGPQKAEKELEEERKKGKSISVTVAKLLWSPNLLVSKTLRQKNVAPFKAGPSMCD
jgi:hypothetical protein